MNDVDVAGLVERLHKYARNDIDESAARAMREAAAALVAQQAELASLREKLIDCQHRRDNAEARLRAARGEG